MMDYMAFNRRGFLRGAVLAPAAAQMWWTHSAKEAERRILFVGTQTKASSKGIYSYKWNPATGELAEKKLAVETDNPTFITIDPEGEHIYAANELSSFEGSPTGAVSSFTIDKSTATLKPINQIAAEGTGTCHIRTSHTGRCLFCANYNGGSATSFFLNPTGSISDPVSHFQYQGHGPNLARQDGPHAHRVTPSPDDRFLLVNDLGLDCIHIYHLDPNTAKLTPNDPPKWEATPGSGPRALRFHPNGQVAYVVYELASAVQPMHWDKEKGTLHPIQQMQTLIPADYHGASRGCDIVLDRKARFAYVINRDYNCTDTFSVDHEGKLTFMERGSCGGKVPRHLALDPTEGWLLIANEDSSEIAVFKRDPETGKLDDKPHTFDISIPQCLQFA